MNRHTRKLLAIITEAAIENVLLKAIESLGAQGYTVNDARGKGQQDVRDSVWETSANIRVAVLCNAATAEAITIYLQTHYYTELRDDLVHQRCHGTTAR